MNLGRVVVKSISWRIVATAITGVVSYVATGSASVAGMIMSADGVIKIVLYVVHEFAWEGRTGRDRVY